MSALPYSPLTRDELQTRVRNAVARLAWYAAAAHAPGVEPTEADVAVMRECAAELYDWQDADVARMGGF